MKNLVETDFDRFYDKLSQLNEKWYTGDDPSCERVWFSASISEARQFIVSLVSSGTVKGVRANIAPNSYAFAKAMDLNHDMMDAVLDDLFVEHADWRDCEHVTIGIPKCIDFETDNYENENPELHVLEPNYDPLKDYEGRLTADCGDFEISLYNFRSKYDFEGSETEKLFKPFIKRLYVYYGKK